MKRTHFITTLLLATSLLTGCQLLSTKVRPAAYEVRLSAPLQWDAEHKTKSCDKQDFKFEPGGMPTGYTYIALGNSGNSEVKIAVTELEIPFPRMESSDLNGKFTLYDAQDRVLDTRETVVNEKVDCRNSNHYTKASLSLSQDTFQRAVKVEFHLSANFTRCQ